MKINFFDALALADVERVHSQVIAWIFHPENPTFNIDEKTLLLSRLFGLSRIPKYSHIDVSTEEQHIDILVIAEGVAGNDIYVIENKLKSSQHSNQLERYKNFINTYTSNSKSNVNNKYFGYLTLLNEDACADSWININYRNLRDGLKTITNGKKPTISGEYILKEYIESLDTMLLVLQDFLTHPNNYQNVFDEGSSTKFKKKGIKRSTSFSEYQRYIMQNQLETPLQKLFLSNIASKIDYSYKHMIGETRGNAYLQYHFTPAIQVNNCTMQYGVQFQGKSIKFNLSAIDYNNSKSDVIDDEIISNFNSYIDKLGYKKLNIGKRKAYISISKSLQKNIWEYSIDELSEIYRNELKKAADLISKTTLK